MISIKKRINNEKRVIYVNALKTITTGAIITHTPTVVRFEEVDNEDAPAVTRYLLPTLSEMIRFDRDAIAMMYSKIIEARGLTEVTVEDKAKIEDTLKRTSIKYNPNTEEITLEISGVPTSANVTAAPVFRKDITNAVIRRGNVVDNKIIFPVRLGYELIIEYTEPEIASVILGVMDILADNASEYIYGPIDAQYLPSDTVVVPVLVEDAPVIEEPAEEEPAPEETPVT